MKIKSEETGYNVMLNIILLEHPPIMAYLTLSKYLL